MTHTKGPGNGLKRFLGLERTLAAGAAAGLAAATVLAAAPASADTLVPGVPAVSSPVAGIDDASAALPSPPGTPGPTAVGAGISESGLAEAVMRDLGLTVEQFNAAGERGKQAADVAAALKDVPGYIGTSLREGRILVTGSGPELEGKVQGLNATVPALVLLEPAAEQATTQVPADPAHGTEVAASTEQLFHAYLREVGPEGLQAVAYSRGKFVIRAGGANGSESVRQGLQANTQAATTEAATGAEGPGSEMPGAGRAKLSAEEFVAKYANVKLDDGANLVPEADVLGGQGYFADTGEICSTGFSAFNPAGLPTVLTAGHCSDDGTAGEASLEFPQWNRAGLLGIFGFSQFGGPGNSSVLNPLNPTNPGNVGTDIAVIEKLRTDLDPEPAASTWGDLSEPGPDVKIIGTAAPVEGQAVCRSGRTSAWSCGTNDEVGIYVVQGRSADPSDVRAFEGFLSFDVQSSGGDSGGPWLNGNFAVGVHSAGDTPDEKGNIIKNYAVAATLNDALAVLPGYQLELFLNKPAVTTPAPGGTYEPGQLISGTVPAAPAPAVAAGSKVRITLPGEAPFDVPVDASGGWTFTSPKKAGPLRFTAETVNGYSASGASDFEFPAPAGEPLMTQPAAPAAKPAPAAESAFAAPAAPSAVPPADPVPPRALPAPAQNPALIPAGDLANTGAEGIMTSAGLGAAAIAAGGLLMVLVNRRKKQRARWRRKPLTAPIDSGSG